MRARLDWWEDGWVWVSVLRGWVSGWLGESVGWWWLDAGVVDGMVDVVDAVVVVVGWQVIVVVVCRCYSCADEGSGGLLG